ncbi:hypothetical protein MTO96_008521 [Rhipicephalus appendiculatus]
MLGGRGEPVSANSSRVRENKKKAKKGSRSESTKPLRRWCEETCRARTFARPVQAVMEASSAASPAATAALARSESHAEVGAHTPPVKTDVACERSSGAVSSEPRDPKRRSSPENQWRRGNGNA